MRLSAPVCVFRATFFIFFTIFASILSLYIYSSVVNMLTVLLVDVSAEF